MVCVGDESTIEVDIWMIELKPSEPDILLYILGMKTARKTDMKQEQTEADKNARVWGTCKSKEKVVGGEAQCLYVNSFFMSSLFLCPLKKKN